MIDDRNRASYRNPFASFCGLTPYVSVAGKPGTEGSVDESGEGNPGEGFRPFERICSQIDCCHGQAERSIR